MLFIDANGNYPRYVGDLLAEFPAWKDGDKLPDGWVLVNETSMPNYDGSTSRVIELEPVLIDGQYFRTWKIENLSEDEVLQAKIWSIKKRLSLGVPVTEDEKALVKEQ